MISNAYLIREEGVRGEEADGHEHGAAAAPRGWGPAHHHTQSPGQLHGQRDPHVARRVRHVTQPRVQRERPGHAHLEEGRVKTTRALISVLGARTSTLRKRKRVMIL